MQIMPLVGLTCSCNFLSVKAIKDVCIRTTGSGSCNNRPDCHAACQLEMTLSHCLLQGLIPGVSISQLLLGLPLQHCRFACSHKNGLSTAVSLHNIVSSLLSRDSCKRQHPSGWCAALRLHQRAAFPLRAHRWRTAGLFLCRLGGRGAGPV
jgi:hypothetical protein